jgi:hypothetical protein
MPIIHKGRRIILKANRQTKNEPQKINDNCLFLSQLIKGKIILKFSIQRFIRNYRLVIDELYGLPLQGAQLLLIVQYNPARMAKILIGYSLQLHKKEKFVSQLQTRIDSAEWRLPLHKEESAGHFLKAS